MDIREHIDGQNLHHAYILEDSPELFESVQEFTKELYPDAEMYVRQFDTFGIDDSRELLHLAHMRSLGTQLFVYHVNSYTTEAQNALLKLLEEPPANTFFFFCTSGVRDLLPTLRSRVLVLEHTGTSDIQKSANNFLRGTPLQRMELVESIIKEKDIHAADAFLRELEKSLYDTHDLDTYREALRHIIAVRRVLHDKGASLKMMLESIVATTPKLS